MHKFKAGFVLKKYKDRGIKYIFIDEISMVQEQFYKFFLFLRLLCPDTKFIISGDFDQLKPVKDRVEYCDYKSSVALYELCDGRRLELSRCRRSDDTLFKMVMPENLEKIRRDEDGKYSYEGREFGTEVTERHLSFTNAKRIEINKMMMERARRQRRTTTLTLEKLHYDKNSQRVELLSGMPVISRINHRKMDLSNNQTFTIKKIDLAGKIVVEDATRTLDIPIKDFQRMFYVAYCVTIHKPKGETCKDKYTIHEFHKGKEENLRLRYVALSRATDFSLINIL